VGAAEGRAVALLAAMLPPLLMVAAAAPDRPVFPPVRDVAVSYHADLHAQGAPAEFTLHYSTALNRARLEGGLPGYVLVDLASHRATIVFEPMGMMMDAPPNSGLDQALVLEKGKRFVRKGHDQVAGLSCTVWDVTAEDAVGTACVTADGVVLRANGHDRKGRAGSIEATSVQYAPQAAALFSPPPNVHRVSIAAGPGGQGLSGLLSGPAAGAVLDRLRGPKP
jgi:hypothetical protein